MNKKILIGIIFLACAVSIFFIVKASFKKEEIMLDQANKVFVVKGDVRIKKAKDDAIWQKMDTSTILEKGDILETAKDSTADIIIGRETDKAIKLKENSHVEFQGINPGCLNLSKGEVLVALKKLEPKSSFVVKTPTAICGARGTGWSVNAGDSGTKICVFESNVYVRALDANGKPKRKEYTATEGTQRTLVKNEPVSEPQKIGEKDLEDWKYWSKNMEFLKDGKVLINDFNRKENFNNLSGAFGSWNMFYTDPNQFCRDELTDLERIGDSGYGLKLTYDVDSPFSAYNGFFTKLMNIDISGYKYLVFSIKGDSKAGFTTSINIELKNKNQIGKATVEKITGEWQKIVIPLSRFAGINDFKNMKEFVIVFTDVTATKKEGVIYIDDIYFSNDEPGN